jgi:predicted RNA-binding protein with PUA-like domain
MAYWLFKTEPDCYSFDHLMAEPGQSTGWDGVRNYQARNYLRDEVKVGDGVLIYHTGDETAIVGIAEVTKAAHPDPTAFDPKHHHYDPKSKRDDPTWVQVTVKAIRKLEEPLSLAQARAIPGLKDMGLLRKGNRLSIQPVTAAEWKLITKHAAKKKG